jgi:DNA (cytosine-5)-methyltransferase 1
MTFGSLFAGIGGIDLGLERAGMVCRWQSEIDPYACQVLAKHWPDIPNLGDIRDIDWTTVERADVVAGGYPCQPFSYAGGRAGADDPRHLWPLFADCLRVVRPRYALLENVSGHLSLGFGRVLGDLAEIGYDAEWDCIPAAAVGAPHLRDRVFVIATRRTPMDTNSEGQPRQPEHGSTRSWPSPMADANYSRSIDRRPESDWRAEPRSGRQNVADADRTGLQGRRHGRPTTDGSSEGRRFWESEPGVGRVANGIPRRVDRLRALGNAVVPQVAEHLGRIILRMETPT